MDGCARTDKRTEQESSAYNTNKWISSLKSNFDTLPFRDQKSIVDTILANTSCQLRTYIEEKLFMNSHCDILTLLPQELQDHLLTFLDASSLLQCSQVSQSWNRIVEGNGKAWYRVCRDLGMNLVEPEWSKPPVYWKTFFLKSSQIFKDMLHHKAFESMVFAGHESRIAAVYYSNGKIATGCDDKTVRIWDSKVRNCERKINTNCTVSCIKFDESLIIVSSYSGCLKSFSFTTGEPLEVFTSHHGSVFSMDFDRNVDVLFSGGADHTIVVWSLSTGQRLKMLHGHTHWVVHVSLNRYKDTPKCRFLMSMDRNDIRLWTVGTDNYDDICCDQRIPIGIPELNFFTPGLHTDGRSIYYIRQDPRLGGYSLFCCWDILEKKLKFEQEIHMPVKMLLAVGQKYACIITPWADNNKPTFLAARITDLEIVARWHCPPSSPTTPMNSQMSICDKEWLDGLNGTNSVGTVMIAATQSSLLYVLNWRNYTDKMIHEEMNVY